MRIACPWIKRRLMQRNIEKRRVRLKRGLRAVPVMDIEVDDGNASQAMRSARVLSADRDTIEQTKTHRGGRLGVMSGGANGAKDVASLARHHSVYPGANAPGGTQGRHIGTLGSNGVRVDPGVSVTRSHCRNAAHVIDQLPRMDTQNLLFGRKRRLGALQIREFVGVQGG